MGQATEGLKKQAKISIGMPVYNGEQFIDQALNSILNQTFTDFELIISDNASTDRTQDICKNYQKFDKRIKYYSNKNNIGLYPNFNRVFSLSTAEYFKWASSDDLCEPEYLRKSIEVMESDNSIVLVYPKAKFIDEYNVELDMDDPGYNLTSHNSIERAKYIIFNHHYVNSINGLIRKSALERTKLFSNYPAADYALMLELSLLGRFSEIPDKLFVRRLHQKSSVHLTADVNYFDKTNDYKIWKQNIDFLKRIYTSRLSATDKIKISSLILKKMMLRKRVLFNEIFQYK